MITLKIFIQRIKNKLYPKILIYPKKMDGYLPRIKQLYGTKKSNFIKGKYKGNLSIENLLDEYSSSCNHFCKPMKYSLDNLYHLKKINPDIWKVKGDKPHFKPSINEASNLVLCKVKCSPTNTRINIADFREKYKKINMYLYYVQI